VSASALPLPNVLLVEDDPVSRAFLAAAAEALPATVHAAAGCAEATLLASAHGYDLWLVDAHLPDGRGVDLLATLRAMHPATPALAHTASTARGDLDALLAAGFAEVLVKPLSANQLQGALRRALGIAATGAGMAGASGAKLPCWDDAAALAALGGERTHVAALRGLFLAELPAQRDAIGAALVAGDTGRAGAVLHRLRASCGFTGAARLAEAVRVFEADVASPVARQCFDEAVDDVLAAPVEAG